MAEMHCETFAEALLARRIGLQQTQIEVANILGTSQANIWRWEEGIAPDQQSREFYEKIADYLGRTLDDVLLLIMWGRLAANEERLARRRRRK